MVFSFGNLVFLKKTGLVFVSHYMTAVQSFIVENLTIFRDAKRCMAKIRSIRHHFQFNLTPDLCPLILL